MLFSRAVRLRNMKEGETLAMVPYADLINHSVFSQAYLDGRQTGDWLFKTGEEEVILHADRGYRRMEQVRWLKMHDAHHAHLFCCIQLILSLRVCVIWLLSSRCTFRMDQSQTRSSCCCMVLQSNGIPSTRWT
jgi:hypothetical protein